MGLWNNDANIMLVAGHRGARVGWPENTLPAFRHAIDIGCDMIETDIRQTKDHQLVLMHDARVDRTTDGTGFVCDYALADFRRLNAAAHVDGFSFECPPTLDELLELTAETPSLLLNLELKDYPDVEGEDWAYETADKTIEAVEKHGLGGRIVLNSFSGKLLKHIHDRYGRRYPLHGFFPYFYLGQDCGQPETYLDCACLFYAEKQPDGKIRSLGGEVCPADWYDALIERGIEPWIGAGVKRFDDLKLSFERGARLITTDNPDETLDFLRQMGHHN